MAVNLKAVATLNIKPYMASLKTLAAENAKLNNTVVRGSKAVTSAQEKETAARQRGAQQLLKNNKAVEGSTRQISRTVQQLDRNTEAYGKKLAEVNRLSADNIGTMSRMTQRQIALRNATDSLRTARQRLADVNTVSRVDGDPTVATAQRALTRADTAYNKALNARRAEVYANQELAKTERLKTQAVVNGTDAAAKQAQTFKSLTNESLNLQRAKDRLAIAEARLASAYTRSSGVLTPAVASARRELASAQIGYNNLAAAQEAAAKSGAKAASGLAAQRYLYHDVSRQAAGLGIALGAIPAIAVVTGAVWENQFANVIRTADPIFSESTMRVGALREAMVGMAKTMPMSFGSLTEIATLGNQMGVASAELEGFTRAVGMFSATSGIAVEEAATAFGRLRTVAGDASFSFMGVADSILKVGVNSVATESEIINVTTQISSIAAQAGFTTKEMIGLSGAMASVRIPPELSRSIITRTFTQFDRAIQKNGTELQTLARVSGRTVEDIKKNWGGPGASDIFLDFTQGLQRAGRQARVELEALGITSVRDVPALLRLSNAADSTGRKGGLLEQTLGDAHTATGEVQRQYAVMVETVVGRLKVLGNSVLSFFDTLGSSSNGFVKGAIDGLTSLFQTMEKIVDNPFSNWALGAMAAVSGIALATSALAKLTAGVKMFQHVGEVVGARSFMSAIGMSKAGGGGADMSPILAGSAALINNFKTGVTSAGATWKNFGNTISSTASWVVAERHIKNTGLGFRTLGDSIKAGTREVPAATGLMGNFARVGLHPVTLGLAAVAAVGVFAYKEWSKGFHMTSTSVDELAKSLSSVNMSNLGEISSVLRTMSISGTDVWQPWQQGFKPFADGMPGLIRDLQIYTKYQEERARAEELGSHAHGGSVWDKQALRNNILAQGIDPAAFSKGLGNIDDAFKEMRAAGNDSAVNDFWINLTKNAGSTQERIELMNNALAKMPNEAKALTTQFELQDMTLQEGIANFGKYSREVRDLAAGFDGTSIIADTFGLGEQEAVDFGKAMNDAAAAFIDFDSALEAGTITDDDGVFQSFDLSAFNKDLDSSMKHQEAWMNNMRTLVSTTLSDGKTVSVDAIQAMGELGPAGKELAQSLVDGMASTDPEVRAAAEKTIKTFEDAVYRSKIDFGPHLAEYTNVVTKAGAMLGEEAGEALNAKMAASLTPDDWSALSTGIDAVIDRHGPELGGRLGKRLFEGLNSGSIDVDQFDTLSGAFSGIGYRASQALMDELDRGISWEQISARIERIQTPKIPVEFEAGSTADVKIKRAFREMFGARGVEVPANFSLETTMGDLRDALKQPGLLPGIDAELTINDIIAKDQFGGFRAWALAQGIDIEMSANPNAAYLTLNSFKMVADETITLTQLDAIPTPAEGKLMEFITLASGKVAVAEVDAETGKAKGKIYELDESAKETQWKEIDADTDDAKAAIEQINEMAKAEETKNIAVTDNGTADAVQRKIDGITGKTVTVTVNEHTVKTSSKQADGSVLQFYANGGVRESHVAQIAPAGAMRVWAEPETGGEAYIPLAKSKRARSEAILNDVAQRFGYSLTNVSKYADGGYYSDQLASRYRNAVVASRGSQSQAGVHIGSVAFTQAEQKDQFREFTRTLNRYERSRH